MKEDIFESKSRPQGDNAVNFLTQTVVGKFQGWETDEKLADYSIWISKGRKVKTVHGFLPAEVMLSSQGHSLLRKHPELRRQIMGANFSEEIARGGEGIIYQLKGFDYVVKQVFPTRSMRNNNMILFSPLNEQAKLMIYLSRHPDMITRKFRFIIPEISTVYQSVTKKITGFIELNSFIDKTIYMQYNFDFLIQRWTELIEKTDLNSFIKQKLIKIALKDMTESMPVSNRFIYQYTKTVKKLGFELMQWYKTNIKDNYLAINESLGLKSNIASADEQEIFDNVVIDLLKLLEIYDLYTQQDQEAKDFFSLSGVISLTESSMICMEAGVAVKIER